MTSSPSDIGSRIRDCWLATNPESFVLRPGATAGEIEQFERTHAVLLPDDLRGYLSTVNGMRDSDTDDEMTGFWGLDRMKSVADYHGTEHPMARDDFILCDIIIDCFWYAVRLRPGLGWGWVFTWGVPGEPIAVARSFGQFAETYLRDRSSLPRELPPIEDPGRAPPEPRSGPSI